MDLSSIVDMIGAGSAVASGGLFGLLGSAFGAWMKAKERKQQAEEKIAERAHQKDMIRLQMEAKSQGAAWDSITTSQQGENIINQQENYRWVVAIKSLFRPFITLFLWIAVGWQMHLIMAGTVDHYMIMAQQNQTLFSASEIVVIIRYIVYSTVFSATTATTWWFGERALSIPEFKNR